MSGRNKVTENKTIIFYLKKYWPFYVMLLPALVWMAMFRYAPMYGVQIAFKEMRVFNTISDAPWVGMGNFTKYLNSRFFLRTFGNTLIISFMRLTLEAPIPIILALLLNEVRIVKFKKTVQTISYLPYFLSWVVVGSFAIIFMAEGDGVLNNFIESLGFTAIPFLTSEKLFRWTLIGTDLWKSAGWGTILYLAALAGLDKNLYEAAYIDGANRWQQTWHITLPGIKSTIVVLFILKIGGLMNAGFEQIFIMYKPGVYAVADIIDTYVYREGIQNGNYGYTTAVGLFKAIINVILLLSANYGAKKLGEKGIW